uniref:Annexin n=1 Tax=Hucho hucho TaxID=62062 RepID=A0A4W5N558_9TELE
MDFTDHCGPSQAMWWGTLGTVRPFPNFNSEKDARDIQTALESSDVNTLVRIMTNRNNAQRQSIAESYHNLTQKELCPALKKALSGGLEQLMLGLMMTPSQFDAHRLRQTMEGIGTDEESLLAVLCTKSPQQLKDATIAYKQGENYCLWALNDAVNGKKKDPAPWIQVLTTRDSNHLNRVLSRLEDLRGETVDKTVQSHFSGDLRLGFPRFIQIVYVYCVCVLQKGSLVQGILISHSEEDLLCVRIEYRKLTNTSLYSALQKEYKGEMQQALLALCRSEDL